MFFADFFSKEEIEEKGMFGFVFWFFIFYFPFSFCFVIFAEGQGMFSFCLAFFFSIPSFFSEEKMDVYLVSLGSLWALSVGSQLQLC